MAPTCFAICVKAVFRRVPALSEAIPVLIKVAPKAAASSAVRPNCAPEAAMRVMVDIISVPAAAVVFSSAFIEEAKLFA